MKTDYLKEFGHLFKNIKLNAFGGYVTPFGSISDATLVLPIRTKGIHMHNDKKPNKPFSIKVTTVVLMGITGVDDGDYKRPSVELLHSGTSTKMHVGDSISFNADIDHGLIVSCSTADLLVISYR